MKKAALFCLTLLVMPTFLAETSFAALTQSEKNYCRNKAQNYADERSAGNTVGGAIITGGRGSGVGTGAASGAGVGGVGGAARSSQRWQDYYWNKYNSCISKYY